MYLDDLKTLEPELENNEEHVDGFGEWTGTDRLGDSFGDDAAEEGKSAMIGDVGGDDAENDRLVLIGDGGDFGEGTELVCGDGESSMEAEVKGGGEEKEEGEGGECDAESEWTSEEAEM